MISNPIKVFVTGNDKKEFLYEGGSTLYHFSPNDNNLSSNMECNVVFYANDELHALNVLKRMFEFVANCNLEYIERTKGSYDKHDFQGRSGKAVNKWLSWLQALEAGQVKVELAPTNQFYIVGWADNDTVY